MRLRRQIWAIPTSTTSAFPRDCTPFRLPSGGLVDIGDNSVITLSQNAVFQPPCSGLPTPQPLDVDELGTATAVIDVRDPFYASTSPQIYAIASATIVSYMLVIILFITPRTFFVSGAAGGGGFLGQNGMISGASRGSSVIGIGSRPWLQKVAALTVAISLTIATADTFKVAQKQYEAGYQDAAALADVVVEGMEIRVVRVISDTCLWLAQVQTLIRLFTRHKEKVIIKWIGFGLIVLDTIFSILNYFVVDNGKTRPRRFVDAIPALNYLFALALSLLYAAWVIYYSLSKRRYAFYHHKMRNIFLIAMLALAAIHIPVVFFVLDIAQPNVAGWGNYVRWVGAAAASVVVWEWVERIEALERDEKKDGILGREIFAGDEMLEVTPSTETSRARPRRDNRKGDGRDGHSGRKRQSGSASTGWNAVSKIKRRLAGSKTTSKNTRDKHHERGADSAQGREGHENILTVRGSERGPSFPAPPAPVASPVSRAETTSATSTLYVVHYHQDQDPTPPPQPFPEPRLGVTFADQNQVGAKISSPEDTGVPESNSPRYVGGWQRITNPFRRRRYSPPPEVAQARANINDEIGISDASVQKRVSSLEQVTIFNRLRPKKSPQVDLNTLPRTIIPPPRRGIDMLIAAESEAERYNLEHAQGNNGTISSTPGMTYWRDKERVSSGVLSATEASRQLTPTTSHIAHIANGYGTTHPLQRISLPKPEDRHKSTTPLGLHEAPAIQANENNSLPSVEVAAQLGVDGMPSNINTSSSLCLDPTSSFEQIEPETR